MWPWRQTGQPTSFPWCEASWARAMLPARNKRRMAVPRTTHWIQDFRLISYHYAPMQSAVKTAAFRTPLFGALLTRLRRNRIV